MASAASSIDRVYRVIDIDLPGDKPHTWEVASSLIRHASDRQITLAEPAKIKLGRWRCPPDMLGRHFFATPEEAIDHFVSDQTERVSRANRTIIDASRAIAWARAQGKNNAYPVITPHRF